MVSRQIDSDDSRDMKARYSAEISKLELRLTKGYSERNIVQGLIDRGIGKLLQ